MRATHLLFPTLAVGAFGRSLFNNTSSNHGASPYHHHAGMGVDVAADPPARRPPPPLPNRRAEPASDELWNRCRDRGCTLSWAMQADDAEVGPAYNPARENARSPFRNLDDLKTWGWSPFPPEKIDESYHNFYATWGIGEALAGLGVSEYSDIYDGGENVVVAIDHRSQDLSDGPVDQQKYTAYGKQYRATGASYSMAINTKEGVLMGLSRLSPKNAATDRRPHVPDDQIPALNQFSDVGWLAWESLANDDGYDVTGLRYLLSVGIVNPFTKSVIRRAMDAKGWELAPWPGHTFERQWFETRAIIGTPNVQGFAYMLIRTFWATCTSTKCKCSGQPLDHATRALSCIWPSRRCENKDFSAEALSAEALRRWRSKL